MRHAFVNPQLSVLTAHNPRLNFDNIASLAINRRLWYNKDSESAITKFHHKGDEHEYSKYRS